MKRQKKKKKDLDFLLCNVINKKTLHFEHCIFALEMEQEIEHLPKMCK